MIRVMTGSQEETKNLWQELEDWSKKLQRWQQFVLHKAVSSKRLTDDEMGVAYQLMLADNELGKEPTPPVDLPTSLTGRPHGITSQMCLVRIENVENVNALPNGVCLRFGPGLTVVYGANATGKSGFFRILAASCFSRSRVEVLPNVYKETEEAPPSADIVIEEDSGERTIKFLAPMGVSDLGRFSVFDASIAEIHLDEENEFSFRPTGFDVFSEMVRVHTYCINKIKHEISQKRAPNKFGQLIVTKDPTPISEMLDSLDASTDLDALKALGRFNAAEQARLEEAQRQLSELRATSVEHISKQLGQAQQDLETLVDKIAAAALSFSPDHYRDYREKIEKYEKLKKMAAAESIESLKDADLTGIGSDEWERFVSSALEYAKKQLGEYPVVGDKCLLCHTPLSDAAHDVLHKTWEYLRGEARSKAEEARRDLQKQREVLEEVKVNVFQSESRIREFLERTEPDTAASVDECVKRLHEEKAKVCKALKGEDVPDFEPVDVSIREELGKLNEKMKARIATLESQSKEEAIKSLANEITRLRHREVLSKNLSDVVRYVEGLKWARKASDVRQRVLPTTVVTNKENELATALVGVMYESQFAQELEGLKCPNVVKPEMKGRSGRTVRTLEIPANYRPVDILSEGEQKAVALADFLTEVGLNPNSAGIVLDDPVTSLDNYRKSDIAARLIREADARQVIIFTHDMEFLALLCELCEREGIELNTHWVQSNGPGKPGVVSENEGPLTNSTYDSAEYARTKMREASSTKGKERHALLRDGFGAIRICLERLVLKKVFKDVVSPYRRHVKMTVLPQIAWSHEVVKEIVVAFTDISSYIDAHFRPDGAAGSDPTVDDLKNFINRYEDLRRKVKEVKKG